MPHLDFSTFAGQVFWLAVTFAALYFVVSRSILPRIGGVVEDRGKHIADDLERAENLNDEAETVEKKYQHELAESSERARALLDESSRKAKEKLESKRHDLVAKLEQKVKKAEAEIAKLEKQYAKLVEDVSGELAEEIAEKIAA